MSVSFAGKVPIHQVILQGFFFETENLATTGCFVREKEQAFLSSKDNLKERAHMVADSLFQYSQSIIRNT